MPTKEHPHHENPEAPTLHNLKPSQIPPLLVGFALKILRDENGNVQNKENAGQEDQGCSQACAWQAGDLDCATTLVCNIQDVIHVYQRM